MRTALILMLGCSVAAAPAKASAGGDAAPSPAGENFVEEDELDFAVQLTAQAYKKQLEILRSMKDPVSAANAVPRLQRSMCMRYKLYTLGFDYARYSEKCDALIHEDAMACAREIQRLEKAGFYGVIPLQSLFSEDEPTLRAGVGDNLLAAPAVPAEEQDELEERLRAEILDFCDENAWLVGGPGFSRDSAWMVTVESDSVEQERQFLRKIWRVSPCGQSLHEVDGHVYDCFYAVYTINGEPHRLEQWFDVTLHHKIGDLAQDDQVAEEDEPLLEMAPPPGGIPPQHPVSTPAASDDFEDDLVAEDADDS